VHEKSTTNQAVPGLASWTMDGFDFHVVSLSVTTLAKYYNVTKTDVTTSITLTLLFRSLGAAIFGIAGDFWGRKYPMVVNMIIVRRMPSFNLSFISNDSIDRGNANVSLYLQYLSLLLRLYLKCYGLCNEFPRISSGQSHLRYRHGWHLG
jgi:MFS family permease